jgi:calcium-dependent protein kinase
MGCGASTVQPDAKGAPQQAGGGGAGGDDKAADTLPAPAQPGPEEAPNARNSGGTGSEKSSSKKFERGSSVLEWQDPKTLTLQENLVQNRASQDIAEYYSMNDDTEAVLGVGMSGQVRKITRLSDGKVFALKTIVTHDMGEEAREELQNEIQILKGLDHPHIGKLYETFEDPNVQIHLVLELCTGGELFDRLMEKKLFREDQTAPLTRNMLRALHYIHCKNIVHRDLKLENWLFRTDQADTDIVLIDFGLSAKFREKENHEEEHLHSRVGTSYYIAPEVLNGDYTSSCDMWSLGVVVYMLLSGTAPFGGSDDNQILSSVMKHEYSLTGERWANISDDAKDFIRKLLDPDPETRFTAEQALEHPWVTKDAAEHPALTIDATTYDNLKQFKKFHELKRIAMDVVAFSLDHSEIGQLSEVFQDMDDDNNGFITFREVSACFVLGVVVLACLLSCVCVCVCVCG